MAAKSGAAIRKSSQRGVELYDKRSEAVHRGITPEAVEPAQIHNVVLVIRVAYWGAEPKVGDLVVFDPPIPTSNRFIE